jgi:hypothetical protein
MTSTTAVRVRWLPLQVTPKTRWTFVESEDREGRVGWATKRRCSTS